MSILTRTRPQDANSNFLPVILPQTGKLHRFPVTIPPPDGSEEEPSGSTPVAYRLVDLLGLSDVDTLGIWLSSWTLYNRAAEDVLYGDANVNEDNAGVILGGTVSEPGFISSSTVDPSTVYLLLESAVTYDLILEMVGENIPAQPEGSGS